MYLIPRSSTEGENICQQNGHRQRDSYFNLHPSSQQYTGGRTECQGKSLFSHTELWDKWLFLFCELRPTNDTERLKSIFLLFFAHNLCKDSRLKPDPEQLFAPLKGQNKVPEKKANFPLDILGAVCFNVVCLWDSN